MDLLIEVMMSIIGIIAAMSGMPQIIKLYKRKSSDDVSAMTWYLILGGQVCWLLYGLYKDSMSLILTSITYTTMGIIIIFLVHKYRKA